MFLSTLSLINFRNFEETFLTFHNGINLLIANNGSGKSNIIEAIQFIATGRSIKTNHHSELINYNKEEAIIEAQLLKNLTQHDIYIMLNKKGKKFLWDKKPIIKTSELYNKLLTVYVSPIDDLIFSGPPTERRNFLDMFLSKMSTTYLFQLSTLKHTVKLLNFHYKHAIKIDEALIDLYHQKIIEMTKLIIKERYTLLQMIEIIINRYLEPLSHKKIRLSYQSTLENIHLKHACEKEIRYKESCFGAHRDDIYIEYNTEDVRRGISFGERRLLGVLLRWAEKEIWNDVNKKEPLLLMDDAFLGIDEPTQKKFLQGISSQTQTFITSTQMNGTHFSHLDVHLAFSK